MVEIGLRLHDVRERVGRDGFQPYLKEFFPRSQTLASQLMQVALHFHDVEPEILGRFHRGALLLLSRALSPPGARAEAIELLRSGRAKSISKSFAEVLIARHGGERAPRHDRRVLAAIRSLKCRLVESHGQLLPETLDELAEEFASAQAELNDARFASAAAVAADAGETAQPALSEHADVSPETARPASSHEARQAQILPRRYPAIPRRSEILPQPAQILPRQYLSGVDDMFSREGRMSESVPIREICG